MSFSLKDTLMNDLKDAMKAKDEIKKSTITMIRAGILQTEKDNKITLDDEQILEVIIKQVKQRKDSLAEFTKAGREDLIEETNKELEILSVYMPKQLSKEELLQIVKEAIEKNEITSLKQMGEVMKVVMPLVKGRADGKMVNEVARELLS